MTRLASPAAAVSEDLARRRHYGVFYGMEPLARDEPVALVVGNCQAESLRLVLDGPGLTSVRVPPVHELVPGDLPHLAGWLARADVLVTQPVHDDYRGLPLGASQLAARLPLGARVVRVPVVRFAGLHPAQAIVRPRGDPSLVPPVVPYHDLRLLAAAARPGRRAPTLRVEAVRAVAEHSRAQLRRREVAHGTVVVSDLYDRPAFALMRTINHPGNPVWLTLARRVRAALGLPETVTDPGRPLLDAIHAPREDAVLAAFGLDDEPDPDWRVAGRRVTSVELAEAHGRFYAAHPEVVAAGLERHAAVLRILGLT